MDTPDMCAYMYYTWFVYDNECPAATYHCTNVAVHVKLSLPPYCTHAFNFRMFNVRVPSLLLGIYIHYTVYDTCTYNIIRVPDAYDYTKTTPTV